jgi:hypothetical protein
MRRMWAGRTISVVAVALLAGCASLPPPGQRLAAQVGAVLEQRKLGPDALRVMDNLVRNGPALPRATPALVVDLLAHPLDAVDADALFRRVLPPSLGALTPVATRTFDSLLAGYEDELDYACQLLRAAVRPFDEQALLDELQRGLPASATMLAVADAVDAEKLRLANRRFVEATVAFARELAGLSDIPEGQTIETEFGTIVIGTRGNDVHQLAPARAGKVAVLIDPGGDDEYRGSDVAVNGFSAIIDLGGNDRYAMDGAGLGAAIAGAALLVDYDGNDSYEARYFAQGAAAFGFGALLDLAGNDAYRVEAWGQGLGIGDGVGLLWDRAGNDRYLAGGVPDPFKRAGGISGAQGVAFGYRDQIAGGTGILRDDEGDDSYQAQMFAQGTGYYFGFGLLWDRRGNDRYHALQYAQGNGVHQAIGVLREESGDDRYELAVLYGQGMGLDVAFGALLDLSGNDEYRAGDVAQGAATANGVGLLADQSGIDRFAMGHGMHRWGYAEWLRGLPTVAVLLHGPGAQFTRNGEPARPQQPALAVEAMTPLACPPQDPRDAMLCRLRGARDDELFKHSNCSVRALALRAWPALGPAQAAVHSDCFRLQAAGVAALKQLGAPLPADAALPSFLRAIPPQDDTY